MTALTTICALASGERPSGGLLPPACTEAGGGTAYGEEAIVAHFRAAPWAVGQAAAVVEAAGHLAIFDEDAALIADLHPGGVGRMWRLAGDGAVDAEPAIGVPFDPDIRQVRGDVAFRAADHPALAADAAPAVEAAAAALARGWDGVGRAPFRARTFVIRAFGDGMRAAALVAVHRLGGDTVRTIGFTYAAVLIEGDDVRVVRDRAGEAAAASAPWRADFG